MLTILFILTPPLDLSMGSVSHEKNQVAKKPVSSG